MKQLLRCACEDLGVQLTETQAQQFITYKDMLLDYNTRLNLTAITEETEVILKHFADSVSAGAGLDLTGKTAIDVGTGAGFPGLPIKLACPEVEMTLLDALQKRLDFLSAVTEALNLTGIHLVHGRAEDAGHDPKLREQFDYCFSRAVAALPVLLEFCLPFVKVGGQLIALKGPALGEELPASEHALNTLGGRVVSTKEIAIPQTDIVHTLLVVEKIGPTPEKYPRTPGKIKKLTL